MNNYMHKFHIPVMGLAFTIDTPIKVAHFGISSVISIVEDRLVEMMRSHYYQAIGKEYKPITTHEPDYRAKRITDYLNLVNLIVNSKFEKLRNATFEAGSEIMKYFKLLPDDNRLRQLYNIMIKTTDLAERERLEVYLRKNMKCGSIDVNIMTKTDKDNFTKSGELIENGSDALAALRGYAESSLAESSVIFSAGMNPRLYNYISGFKDFNLNEEGTFKKRIIVKVSDYRSAFIQGKYLAKKGIWVSEFRVESGLNCGGHAFATDGYLMGPILEEFKVKREELITTLFEIFNEVWQSRGGRKLLQPPRIKFSAQGGIGTHEEDALLHDHFKMDSTGWGTPFLLVPEATTVDEGTLKLLGAAAKQDIILSHSSPLGVRFHYLKGTTAEKEKMQRISEGRPGSPCTEKHLAFNTEFTKEPICTASRKYQKLKLAQLDLLDIPAEEYQKKVRVVLDKECLCVGLSNSAAINLSRPFVKNLHAVTICPGPNIVHFSRVVSLETMADHIYGRDDIVTNPARPHMFIAELNLYIDYLKELVNNEIETFNAKAKKYQQLFCQNLQDGINYYRQMSGPAFTSAHFSAALNMAEVELDFLTHAITSRTV